MKKVNPEHEKIIDEIIARRLAPQDALIEIFERCHGVKFITTLKNPNDKPNKKD